MYLIQFLLPLRDNERQPFPRADFERVRAELERRFQQEAVVVRALGAEHL
jgi:hypothetical protein